MEEQKKVERTIKDVEQEYAMLCQKAGHAQYQVYVFERDLNMLNERLKELNLEAAALHGKAAEESKNADA